MRDLGWTNLRFFARSVRFRGLCGVAFAILALGLWQNEVAAGVHGKPELRRLLLSTIQERPETTIKVIYAERMSPEARAFLDYFQREIWGFHHQAQADLRRSGFWSFGLSEAWYRNESQKKEWERARALVTRKVRKLQGDVNWAEKVREWARLSQGLVGALPDFARALNDGLPDEEPTKEERQLEAQIDRLDQKIDRAWNERPDLELESAYHQATVDVLNRYDAGEVTLEEAIEAYEKAESEHPAFFADPFLQKAGPWMNEVALLRSKQAKQGGHKNWAQWQAHSWGDDFDPELASIAKLRRFLNDALAANDKDYVFLIRRRLGIYADATRYELTPSHLDFLVSRDFSLEERLVDIDVVQVWKKFLRSAGFGERCFDKTVIDCKPRKNKSLQNEMMPLEGRRPRQLLFDGRSKKLSPQLPRDDRSESWHDAENYLFLNFGDGTIRDLEILLHEGAHALDYFFRRNPFDSEGSTAYSEVWPALFERLLLREDFVRSLSSRRLGDEELRTYLRDRESLNILNFRLAIAEALTELDVWNYDFDQAGAETFVERSQRLYGQHVKRAMKLSSLGSDASAARARKGIFRSTHLFSARVDYSGYVLAEIVAKALETHLQDRVWREGGDPTLLGNPRFGKILREEFLPSGFMEKFPSVFSQRGVSIEPMIKVSPCEGRSLDPEAQIWVAQGI